MRIEEISQGGANVPVTRFESVHEFSPSVDEGAVRYAAPVGRDIDLEALQVNRNSDVLVVAFHGALIRETTELPRFERLAGLLRTDYSILAFSDPTLRLSDDLQLSWYTGWQEQDMRPLIADWTVKVAKAVGAEHVLFVGGSGGGFASLQVSAFVPGSMALAFNPQTILSNYLVEGVHMGPQRRYVRVVVPELAPVPIEKLTMEHDWASPLGERASVPMTYGRELENRVLFVQNSNDFSHMESHYGPFRDAVDAGPNAGNVRFEFYEGPKGHVAQSQEVMDKGLADAVAWIRS